MEWNSKVITHKGEKRIAVFFGKDDVLIDRIKRINGSRWSQSRGVWHLPDTDENREIFGLALIKETLPSGEGIMRLENFKRWMRSKRYS